MSTDDNSALKLLCELRRFAGETPLNARIAPMQWVAVARESGLSEAQRSEAIIRCREAEML
jgi:hypothetical protein